MTGERLENRIYYTIYTLKNQIAILYGLICMAIVGFIKCTTYTGNENRLGLMAVSILYNLLYVAIFWKADYIYLIKQSLRYNEPLLEFDEQTHRVILACAGIVWLSLMV